VTILKSTVSMVRIQAPCILTLKLILGSWVSHRFMSFLVLFQCDNKNLVGHKTTDNLLSYHCKLLWSKVKVSEINSRCPKGHIPSGSCREHPFSWPFLTSGGAAFLGSWPYIILTSTFTITYCL
jgi:hypothetical protein